MLFFSFFSPLFNCSSGFVLLLEFWTENVAYCPVKEKHVKGLYVFIGSYTEHQLLRLTVGESYINEPSGN